MTCTNSFTPIYAAGFSLGGKSLLKWLAEQTGFFEANSMASEANKLKALSNITWIKPFWEFNHHVVAKLHGFKGVDDYCQ